MSELEVQGEFRSANRWFFVARTAHGLAEDANADWERRHHCITGVVFTAFAFEAMLSHYGHIIFDDWPDRRKSRIPRKEQHKDFFEHVNLPNYLGRQPYQTINKLFRVRDDIAHAETKDDMGRLQVSEELDREKLVQAALDLPLGVEKELNVQRLGQFIDAIVQVQTDIEAHGYYPLPRCGPDGQAVRLLEQPLYVSGVRTWCAPRRVSSG